MDENPTEIDLRIRDLERLCDELRRQLEERAEESRSARRLLELQKIILVQERDDLYRQRQSLIVECSELKAKLQRLEPGSLTAASARHGRGGGFRARIRGAWLSLPRPSRWSKQPQVDHGNPQ
jgi:hypothetical protein